MRRQINDYRDHHHGGRDSHHHHHGGGGGGHHHHGLSGAGGPASSQAPLHHHPSHHQHHHQHHQQQPTQPHHHQQQPQPTHHGRPNSSSHFHNPIQHRSSSQLQHLRPSNNQSNNSASINNPNNHRHRSRTSSLSMGPGMVTSPSHSSAVLSKLERKKRLLACLDGGVAPPSDDTTGSSDRNSISSGCSNLNSTSTSSRIPVPNPPKQQPSHASHNGMNSSDLTTHSSLSKQQQQPRHLSHSSPLHHYHHGQHHQTHHSTSTSSASSYHHHSQSSSHHNHHHHNSSSSGGGGGVGGGGSSSSGSGPILSHQQSSSTSSNPSWYSPRAFPTNPPSTHQTKLSSSSIYSPSHLTSNHVVNNNNNSEDNIIKTPTCTNDLNRRINNTSLKTISSETNDIINDYSSSTTSTKATLTKISPALTPFTATASTHRISTSGSSGGVGIGSISGGIGNVNNSQTINATPASMTGSSDKPKKTSSSYLLPNSIYNKAGPGQKSSTLSSYTQLLNKGDDSKTIDIGSQAINADAQDPRLTKIQERVGSVLTTITNNEEFLISTKIHSSLDDHITLVDSIKVTSSELIRRNKLKNPTTNLADSTTHKIDDQSSSEVSSSSDADLSKILVAPSKSTTTTTTTANLVSSKPVMNLPLPKFACVMHATSETVTKKPTPDRELTTVSSSNKLLLNKTPLISLSTARNHLSPSLLASFSTTAQTATATTPTVDYSKFNIRKKTPVSASCISGLDHATSLNTASASTSSDDEKTSPMRVEIETSQHTSLDDSEDQSTQDQPLSSALPSPVIERKQSTASDEPDVRQSSELNISTPEEKDPSNVITRRVSLDEKPTSRKGSLSPPKMCREKPVAGAPLTPPIATKKAPTPDIKPQKAASSTTKRTADKEKIVHEKTGEKKTEKSENALSRKKFEIKLKERLHKKDKFKIKSSQRGKTDQKSSAKSKNVSKCGLKSRVRTKGTMKPREKGKQKKSSLFSFADEPIYLSMYDKVKARSSALKSHASAALTPTDATTSKKEVSIKEQQPEKSRPEKRQGKQCKHKLKTKPSTSRIRKDSSASSSSSNVGPRSDDSSGDESSDKGLPPRSTPQASKSKSSAMPPVAKTMIKKKTRKKNEKRIVAKDFELRPKDIRARSPSPKSNSTRSSSSSSSSSSSASSSSSSSSSHASLSSSSDNEEDEDAELSAIVAEAAGRIGDEINVNEAANSPQLSPPPSPVTSIESNLLMKTISEAKTTPVDETIHQPSSWSNLVSSPLHINLPLIGSCSSTNTPSPRKSGPDLIMSSPSICAKSLVGTPECSPGSKQVPGLAPEPSTLDSRCETEQAISTLLMEMDTDSISENPCQDLLIEVDTRTNVPSQSLSPRKLSPIKLATPPPATPTPPVIQQSPQHPSASPPRSFQAFIYPEPELPIYDLRPNSDLKLSPEINSTSIEVELNAQDQANVETELQKDTDLKLSHDVIMDSESKSANEQTPSQELKAETNSIIEDKPTAIAHSISNLVGETQSGKHANLEDTTSIPDDSRPDVKRVRRNRKKSSHISSNAPTTVDVSFRLEVGQQPKMSPYDIFEFRDSDDEESATNKPHTDPATIHIKTPDVSSSGPGSGNVISVTCKLANPPISTNLLQTVATMQPITEQPLLSPKIQLNLAQPCDVIQRSPPQPAISPSNSSNENKDPAQQGIGESDNLDRDQEINLLQTVDIKTDLLKSLTSPMIKMESAEESMDTLDPAQRQREYVTELSQDGKLSLTIRKASNQAKELYQESSRVPEKHIIDPDTEASTNAVPSGNDNLSDSSKANANQSMQTPNVKPTRRSARLMQTSKKEPSQDDQAGPKEDTIAATSAHPLTVLPSNKISNTTSIVRDHSLSNPISENQQPEPCEPAINSQPPKNLVHDVEDSQPSTAATQSIDVIPQQTPQESAIKTRRTRSKKVSTKHSTQLNTQSQAPPPPQQLTECATQPHKQQELIQTSQTTQSSELQSSEVTTPNAIEGRRPKRLTRLAAKTYGGNIPAPLTRQEEIEAETTCASASVDASARAAALAPIQNYSPLPTQIHVSKPTSMQAPTQTPTQIPTPTQMQAPVKALTSAPEPIPIPIQLQTPAAASAPTLAPVPCHVRTVMLPETLPMRNATPNVEASHPVVESAKVASFCIPSYLPPRKRLGWFWSQKQLLEQRYLVVWTSRFTLKDSFAAVQMHFISGNNKMPSWSYRSMLDDTGMPLPIQINQRMRLDPDQLEGVQRKIANEEDHCVLLAIPVGRDQSEYLKQSTSLRVGFIDYLTSKEAAGIVYVCQPGEAHPSYIIHIFPSCTFVNDHILQREPDLLNVTQNIDNLIVVITTA